MNIIQFLSLFALISSSQLLVEGQRSAGCARPRIENGRSKIRARGKMVYYRCRKKFQRVGAKFAVCLSTGQWSLPPPVCIGRGCPPIVPSKGLQISGEYNGAMLKFTCSAGMKRKGPESIYCNGKKWSADQPSCVVGISLQCDFEEEELCGWSQSDKDDFEWTWFSGNTPTVNTGPLHDHTFGSGSSGHYLFIESSSPRKPMDRAILASPLYQAKYSDICFEFWYHMQGPDEENAVGSLEVFVKPESQTLDEIDPEFFVEGNQHVDWLRGSIYIQNQTEVFQIIIVGTRKEAFVSDIAIDDVRMYNCSEDSFTNNPLENLTTSDVELESMTTQSEPNLTSTVSDDKSEKTTAMSSRLVTPITTTVIRKPNTTPKSTTIMTLTTTVSTTIKTTRMKTTKPPTTTIVTSIRTTPEAKPHTTIRQTTKQTTPRKLVTTKPPTSTTEKPTTLKPKKITPVVKTGKPVSRTRKQMVTGISNTTQTATPSTTAVNIVKTNQVENDTVKNTPIFNTTQTSSWMESSTLLKNFTESASPSQNDGNMTINVTLTDLGLGVGVTQTSVGSDSQKSMTPLIIGISCGIAVGLVVIAVLAYLWARRQRNKLSDETIEEMAPITNAEGGYYHPG